MTHADEIPMAFFIVLALTVIILAFAFIAARYTIWRDQREIERRAKANVAAWWAAAEYAALPDDDEEKVDGNDEGLVRVPPDVLLRQTFASEARKEA